MLNAPEGFRKRVRVAGQACLGGQEQPPVGGRGDFGGQTWSIGDVGVSLMGWPCASGS